MSIRKVIVADDSKFKPSLRGFESFCGLSKDITVITNESENNSTYGFAERVKLIFAPPFGS